MLPERARKREEHRHRDHDHRGKKSQPVSEQATHTVPPTRLSRSQQCPDKVPTDPAAPRPGKILAVGLIHAVDIFLIAIAVYIISLGLYSLFVDASLPLPRWLEVHDLEDLKANLVSIVIAVLAVLFLREAVAWDGEKDLLRFGTAVALVIAALTLFLARKGMKKD